MESLKIKGLRVLKWTEGYTKTDMVYLAKGGFWLGLGQFVSSGAAFLTSIAFANLLSPEIFGVYKYILSITSLLTITTLSGMDSALTQAIARGFDGTLAPAVRAKMKWGVLGSFLSLLLGGYYYLHGNMTMAIAFCSIAIFMPFTESLDMYNSMLWGKKLFSVQVNYNIVKKIFALVSLVTTIFLTHNIYIILFVYFISVIIPNLIFLNRTKKIYAKNNDVDPEAINYGKHLSGAYIISTILSELDKVLVFHFVGAIDLAIYSLATAPTDQIKGLLKNVNSLAMPQFSQRSVEEIKQTLWHKVIILTLFITTIVIFYILISPIFFKIFFPKYLSSIYYSQILSISLIPVIISGFIYTILESQKSQKEIYQYNLYGNLFGIIILIPLVYFFGIWGAISSKIITRFFSLGLVSKLIRNIS
ncbi:oligosaccharide flippase family protein [Patescibacteria group bacterium]|nr:oligosaccharide flippase family protein [Patescibacteria group bacterium]